MSDKVEERPTIRLEWRDEMPGVPGHWLRWNEDRGMTHQYVTAKDIALVNGDMPWWLGNGRWCGPIEEPDGRD